MLSTLPQPRPIALPGASRTLSAASGGVTIANSSVRRATDNSAVAQASAGGILIARVPGRTPVTATDGSATASAVVEVADQVHLGSFTSPLAQSVALLSVFDHNLPFEFVDNDG